MPENAFLGSTGLHLAPSGAPSGVPWPQAALVLSQMPLFLQDQCICGWCMVLGWAKVHVLDLLELDSCLSHGYATHFHCRGSEKFTHPVREIPDFTLTFPYMFCLFVGSSCITILLTGIVFISSEVAYTNIPEFHGHQMESPQDRFKCTL